MTTKRLKAIPLDGITADILGHYLAGLGVLFAISQKWPEIRGCWRNGRFVLLAEAFKKEDLIEYLMSEWRQTVYDRWWSKAQKNKLPLEIWHARNAQSATDVRPLDAHIVCASRIVFNPIVGAGGVWGRRDWAKTKRDAVKLLQKHAAKSQGWLEATLSGEVSNDLPTFSGAGSTWFVYANKTFNSGQSWYREGRLSPWAFLFALEGALLLSGGVNKRLGSRARPYAVFPFISDPESPLTAGQVGASKGEFWAPLWEWPATFLEVRSIFQRGLARLGGNPARAPHEFAVAALSAGVDAGIFEFARFELRQTTSSKVYEAIPRAHIRVRGSSRHFDDSEADASSSSADKSHLLMELLDSRWLDQQPLYEPRDSKQRGEFVGIRGPIEAAIIAVAERPDEAVRWQSLLLRMADAQFRIDRNRNLREHCRPLPQVSLGWFERAWPPEQRSDEIELAAAIASISHWPSFDELRHRKAVSAVPLLVNVFGVEVYATANQESGMRLDVRFPQAKPQRAVWHRGDPLQVLADVAQRRLVDSRDRSMTLARGSYSCADHVIDRLLRNDPSLDLELMAQWVPPLALLNWSQRTWQPPRSHISTRAPEPDGASLLDALFRPFFQPTGLTLGNDEHRRLLFDPDPSKNQWPTPTVTRRLFNLIHQGTIDDAVELARSRYLAVECPIVPLPVNVDNVPMALAAALLVPMKSRHLQARLQRWLQPAKASF